PETVDDLRERLQAHPFDYVIGSVHFLADFKVDSSATDWEALNPEEVNEKWRLYWLRIGEMAQSRVFDFVGHLDLPKKFGFRPTADLSVEEDRALDAIAAAGMAIEINTNGWNLAATEAYPALNLLRKAHS